MYLFHWEYTRIVQLRQIKHFNNICEIYYFSDHYDQLKEIEFYRYFTLFECLLYILFASVKCYTKKLRKYAHVVCFLH